MQDRMVVRQYMSANIFERKNTMVITSCQENVVADKKM